MRKLCLGLVLVLVLACGLAMAETPGDIDGDDAVGLPEAVNALQVASGLKADMQNVYDFSEYYSQPDSTYCYKTTYVDENGADSAGYEFEQAISESLDNETVLVEIDHYGWRNMYAIRGNQMVYLGYEGNGSEPVWNKPPRVIGTIEMKRFDVYTTCYEYAGEVNGLSCTEYTFLGVEDVVTPAGTFKDCLKISRKYYPSSSPFSLRYYARNVGLVKFFRASSYGGTIRELAFAQVGQAAYPQDGFFSRCSGTYTFETVDGSTKTGSFTLNYIQTKSGFDGAFVTEDYAARLNYSVSSTDGTNFSGRDNRYGNEVVFTITGNTIQGTIAGETEFSGTCGQ